MITEIVGGRNPRGQGESVIADIRGGGIRVVKASP